MEWHWQDVQFGQFGPSAGQARLNQKGGDELLAEVLGNDPLQRLGQR
jgi:hypothetical protein